MSVQTNTYVLVGVMVPYDTFDDDQCEAMTAYWDSAFDGVHHHNGLCVISDSMGGRYHAIGRVLGKSGPYEGIEEPIDCTVTDELRGEVARLLAEQFELNNAEVKTWVFTHYR